MKILKKKAGQGATEYLLILAAVLVIVGVAVFIITRTTPKPNILLTAQKDGTSIELHATGGTDTCPAADWQFTVHDNVTAETWTLGTAVLSSDMADITLSSGLTSGTTYTVRVQHKPSGLYFWDTPITI